VGRIKTSYWIFLIPFIAFLLVRNQEQGFDSYVYALNVRDGFDLFHPHHLLYNYIGRLLYQIFGFGASGSLEFLSGLSSVLGALSLANFYSILRNRLTNLAAISYTFFIGGIYSFWYYSTSVEVNMPAILFFSAALYWLFNRKPSGLNSIIVFAFVSLSILFHQIMALAVIPILIYMMARQRSVSKPILYALPGLLSVTFLYIVIGLSQAAEKSLSGIYYWITLYSHSGVWGKFQVSAIITSFWGITKAMLGGAILREVIYGGNITTGQIAYLVIVAIVLCGIAFIKYKAFTSFWRNRTAESWLLLSLSAIFAIFVFWWAPSDEGFWLYILIPGILFIGFNDKSAGRLSYVPMAVVIIMLTINLVYEYLPASSKKSSMVIQASTILHKHNLSESDFVLTDLSQVRSAMNYYYQLKANTTSIVYTGPGDKEATIKTFQDRIDNSLRKGRVFVFENELRPEPHRRYMYERFSPQDYLNIYKPYYPYITAIDSLPIYGKMTKIFQIDKMDKETSADTSTNNPAR
jgi:hypothetical protein